MHAEHRIDRIGQPRTGPVFDHLGTAQPVRDLDALRASRQRRCTRPPRCSARTGGCREYASLVSPMNTTAPDLLSIQVVAA
ncbi:hypothetical protein [Streptomyces sp. F-1]|uniref:hypothetical protein n=1 Tax=Streptomyces sp. F-1 TaxID=463642 RepID=UPI00085BE55A|nr:hypothetical protein [Streptomyces sp. F-1]